MRQRFLRDIYPYDRKLARREFKNVRATGKRLRLGAVSVWVGAKATKEDGNSGIHGAIECMASCAYNKAPLSGVVVNQ